MQRLGIGPWELTPAALSLLVRRRRVRMISQWAVCAPILALIVVIGVNTMRVPDDFTASAMRAYVLRAGVFTAVIGLVCLAQAEVKRVLDRRLTASLSMRVSRPERVPLVTILGRVRTLCIVVLLLGQATAVGALFAVHISGFGAYRYGFLIAFAGCATATVLGVVREVNRPAIAVDAVSLAVDERLRSEDAFAAIWPVIYLGISGMTNLAPVTVPGWFAALDLVISAVSILAWIVALAVKPWPKFRPAAWMVPPVQPAR